MTVPRRRAAVLGSPIAHSLSPALHRAAYELLGLDWRYDAVEIDEAMLPAFLAGLDDRWVGLSLTMPLKAAVIPLLDEVSETAAAVGAVNTVLLGERRRGENTDVPGLVAALGESGVTAVERACVLGGGATARSAVAALGRLGARVEVVVRTPARAADLQRAADRCGVALDVRPWNEAGAALSAPVVFDATPAGATDPLIPAVPPAPGLLVAASYHPWPSRLAQAWEAAGGTAVSGLPLLVNQAVLQVRLMTGLDHPRLVERLHEAARQAATNLA